MKRVLGLPPYRHLLVAYGLNELAWSIATVTLSFLIYRRTGSAAGTSAFFLCAMFVPALLAPALVARLDQRPAGHVLPLLYALEALAYLGLAAIARSFSLVPILALVLLDGILAQSARALARTATVAVTSPAGLLREGNALNNSALSVCVTLGPILGGAVVAAKGAAIALLVNCGVFALITVTLLTARGLPAGASDRAPARGRLRAAVAEVRRRPAVRVLMVLQGLGILFFTISVPVEVVLAQRSLHAGAGGYGALLSIWGAGLVAGSVAYGRWRRLPARVLIALGAAALGAGFVVMAAAPTLAVALAGAAAGGFGNGIEAVAARTALQEHVPPAWMAMVMSLNESIYQAVPGLGILIGGLIAGLAGARPALAVAGAGALGMAAMVWLVLRPPVFEERREALAS